MNFPESFKLQLKINQQEKEISELKSELSSYKILCRSRGDFIKNGHEFGHIKPVECESDPANKTLYDAITYHDWFVVSEMRNAATARLDEKQSQAGKTPID